MQEVDISPRCAYCGTVLIVSYHEDVHGDGVPYHVTHCSTCQNNRSTNFFKDYISRCPICDSARLIGSSYGFICSNPYCSSFSIRKIRNMPKYRVRNFDDILAIYNSLDNKFYYNKPYKEIEIPKEMYINSLLYKVIGYHFERRK